MPGRDVLCDLCMLGVNNNEEQKATCSSYIWARGRNSRLTLCAVQVKVNGSLLENQQLSGAHQSIYSQTGNAN